MILLSDDISQQENGDKETLHLCNWLENENLIVKTGRKARKRPNLVQAYRLYWKTMNTESFWVIEHKWEHQKDLRCHKKQFSITESIPAPLLRIGDRHFVVVSDQQNELLIINSSTNQSKSLYRAQLCYRNMNVGFEKAHTCQQSSSKENNNHESLMLRMTFLMYFS